MFALGMSATFAVDASAISPRHQGVPLPEPIAQRHKSLEKAAHAIKVPGVKTIRTSIPRPATAPLRAKSRSGEETVLYGNQVYSSEWTSNSSFGIYSLNTADGTTSAVHTDPDLYGVGGAVYYDGKYYALSYVQYNGNVVDISASIYDTQTWTQVEHKQLNASQYVGSIALDLAYDATTEKVFGLFYAGNYTVYLGTLDMRTFVPTPVASLPSDTNINTIAFTSAGALYGTDDMGNFYSIDKTTAQITKLSSVGEENHYCSYFTTAAIDDASGTYYYIYQPEEGNGSLYAISLADGTWTALTQLPNEAQFTGLYVPKPLAADGAPAAVGNASATFAGGSLSGTVNFTMPSVTFGGAALDGQLEYTVTANGAEAASGTADAGAEVSAPVTVAAAGFTTFAIRASNAHGASPKAEITIYVGEDAPVAVSDLSAEKASDSEIAISWTAPTASVNGGYFDADAMTYTVVRRPDGKIVAEGITATECTDQIGDIPMASYYYEVTARAGEAISAPASTDVIVLGSYVPLPIDHQFNQADKEFELYTVIDANGDNKKWMAGTSYVYMTAPAKDQEAEDDWLITPPIYLVAGKSYTLEYEAGLNTTGTGSPEGQMEVMLGTDKTPEAFATNIVSSTHAKKGYAIEYKVTSKDFSVDADGIYYIGFHGVTPKAQSSGLRIRFIKIYSASLPVEGEIKSITPAAEGALTASVEYTAPTKDRTGADLEGLLTIKAYVGKNLKKTIEGVAPGATITFDVETAQGSNTVTVSASNADGEGPVATQTVFTGFDYPLNPTDVKAVISDDGTKVTVTWTAPGSTGERDGYVPADQLSFYIFDAFGQYTDPAIASTTETSYTFDYAGKDFGDEGQDFVAYQITASYTVGNVEYASNPGTNSNILTVGQPYSLPFSESYPDATPEHTLWGIDYADTRPNSEFALFGENQFFEEYDAEDNPIYINSQDGDGGFIVLGSETNGLKIGFYSGMIDISGTTNPALEFYTRATGNQLDVMLGEANKEYASVKTIDFKETPYADWTLCRIPLNDYIAVGTIQFELLVTTKDATSYGTNYVAIDHIRVRDIRDNNLSIGKMSVPAEIMAGSQFGITAKVSNDGLNAASDFAVKLLHNGSEIQSFAPESALAPDATIPVSFDGLVLDATDKGENTFTLRIEYASDEIEGDNAVEKSVEVTTVEFPGVDGLSASFVSEPEAGVALTWVAPDLDALPKAEEILEDFESYEAFTIENFGPWTLFDEDGKSTYAAYDEDSWEDYVYPHASEAIAFQIFNASQINATEGAYGAYSGNQCAMSFYAWGGSDWLISPEISGSQTISFMAAYNSSLNYCTGDDVEVWYSTGSTDIADFVKIKSYATTEKWTLVTADLPADARRFAIHSITGYNGNRIDDIRYKGGDGAPADLAVTGYNVYRNGIRITADPIAETSFTDHPDDNGTYEYSVSAVYNYGETDPCAPVSTDFSAIGSLGPDDAPVRYYNLQGIEIAEPADGSVVIRVQGRTAAKQLRR